MTMPAIEVTEIARALRAFCTPAEIDLWLDAPHPQLAGRSASSLIAEGRGGEVMAVVERLRDCVSL